VCLRSSVERANARLQASAVLGDKIEHLGLVPLEGVQIRRCEIDCYEPHQDTPLRLCSVHRPGRGRTLVGLAKIPQVFRVGRIARHYELRGARSAGVIS
jgi:hypothetical protein